jgi:ADP-heptose:LPS heptosyltransferase
MAVIALSNLFIGPNSGLMVIATALETPTIGLFGAFNPKVRVKYYDKFTYLWGRPPCAPCKEHWTECSLGYPAPCMRIISVEQVHQVVAKMLQTYKRKYEERRAII